MSYLIRHYNRTIKYLRFGFTIQTADGVAECDSWPVPPAAVRVFTPILARARSKCFFDGRRAGAQNIANVAVYFLLDHTQDSTSASLAVSLKLKLTASTTASSEISGMAISKSLSLSPVCWWRRKLRRCGPGLTVRRGGLNLFVIN